MPTHLLAKMKTAKLISRLSLLFLKLKSYTDSVENVLFCFFFNLNVYGKFVSTNLGLNCYFNSVLGCVCLSMRCNFTRALVLQAEDTRAGILEALSVFVL